MVRAPAVSDGDRQPTWREAGGADAGTVPDMAAGVARFCKRVAIQYGADITRRLIRERVSGEQADGGAVVVEEFFHQRLGPGIFVGCGHGGEPHCQSNRRW